MTILRTAFIVLALLIAACASYEGVYEPACIAFEGDRITLRAGRFEWQRFTDQRSVDDDGNVVNPFPGFPRTGRYRINRGRLQLHTNDDDRLDDWVMVEQAGQRYLLTIKQHDAFLDGNELPPCVLRLTGTDS